MLDLNLKTVKAAQNKKENNDSVPELGPGLTDSASDMLVLLVSTEEHLLSLSSTLPQADTDDNDGSFSFGISNTELENKNANSPVFPDVVMDVSLAAISVSTFDKVNADAGAPLFIGMTDQENMVGHNTPKAEPTSVTNIVFETLSETDVSQAMKIAAELHLLTPIVIPKESQTEFSLVPGVSLLEAETQAGNELENDVSESVTDRASEQLSDELRIAAIGVSENIQETPVFVTSELIAKVVSTASSSWSTVGIELVEKTVMLLNNGMAYIDLTSPPGSLILPDTLENTDSRWTTWRQDESGAIYLAKPDSELESLLVGEEIDLTPLKNEDVAGLHTKMTAVTYGATMVTTWSDIKFNLDGTFEQASSVLTTTGSAGTMLLDTFTASFHQHTASGSSDIISGKSELIGLGDAVVQAAGSTYQSPNKHLYGSYNLLEDGLTIEMHYANGVVKRELFYQSNNYVNFETNSYKTQQYGEQYLEDILNFTQRLESGSRVIWLSLVADSVMDNARKAGVGPHQSPTTAKNSFLSDTAV